MVIKVKHPVELFRLVRNPFSADSQRHVRPAHRLAYLHDDRNESGTDAVRQANVDSNDTGHHARSRTHVQDLRAYRKDWLRA